MQGITFIYVSALSKHHFYYFLFIIFSLLFKKANGKIRWLFIFWGFSTHIISAARVNKLTSATCNALPITARCANVSTK